MSERPVLIIDGLNLFMRHFVVNPTLSDSGLHVGGSIGFLNSIKFLSNRIGPSRVIVAWEGGGSSRRRAIYKNYKQGKRPQRLNRYYKDDLPDTVENRDDQISLTIELLRNVPVEQVYVPDCEADDVISYIVKYMLKDKRIVVASSDKDLYQLLSKTTMQWSPGQKKFITIKDVLDKFDISATNFCTARCFVGDPSDGLKGVSKVGFSSLVKRFPELTSDEFVSVEDIIEKSKILVENSKLVIYTNIVEDQDTPKRNWKLMFLDTKNLSADQIKKIQFLVNEQSVKTDKIGLIRKLQSAGIKNFDADSFYASVQANLRRNTK